jgi:hypothetical protein
MAGGVIFLSFRSKPLEIHVRRESVDALVSAGSARKPASPLIAPIRAVSLQTA